MAINYKVEVDVKDAEKKLDELGTKFEQAFNAGRSFDGTNARLRQLINNTSTYVRQLKKEFQDTAAALEGRGIDTKSNKYLQQLAKDIKTAESELEGLRENMKARRMESENMFQGMAQGASALMGAFTAVQGAAALFGAEEEKLAHIQTKLQASMSILMGLQRAGNLLNSQSQFRIQVVNKLMEAWHRMNLKVATSEGIKRAAMLGVVGAIAAVITGLTALLVHLSRNADKVKEMRELQKAWHTEFKNSATEQLVTFKKLQAGWEATNGDIREQRRFISQNQGEFESLGKSIESVEEAENFLIQNKDAFIESMKEKARAAADLAKLNLLVAKSIEYESQIEEAETKKPGKFGYFLYRLGAMQGGQSYMSYDEYAKQAVKANIAGLEEKKKEYDRQIDELVTKISNSYTAGQNEVDKKKFNDMMADRADAVRKGYESLLRLEQNRENALADAKIAAIWNESERELAVLRQAHEKRMQEIENDKKDYIEKLREQAKLEYSVSNPNGDADAYARSWQPSDKQQKKIDEYYEELAQLEIDSFERSQRKLFQKMQKTRLDYWKQYGTQSQRERAIIEEYNEKINEAVENSDFFEILRLNNEKQEKLWQERNASRLAYLDEYGTIEEKEKALTEKYQHDMLQITDKYQKQIRTKQYENDRFNLQRQKGGKYYNIFRDTDRMNIVQITDAIKLAEDEIERLSKDAAANADKIEALKSALENLKKAAKDFSLEGVLRQLFSSDKDNPGETASFAERMQKIVENWNAMSADAKASAIGGWAKGLADSLQRAAGFMKQVADTTSDPKLAESAERLSAMAQNLQAAGAGAAAGGWIGAIAGGVSDIAGQTIEAVERAKMAEAEAKRNAEDWARALRNVASEMQEIAYSSPFGERSLAKGREAMRASLEDIRLYQAELDALNKKYSNQNIWKYKNIDFYSGYDLFAPAIGSAIFRYTQGDKISNEFKAYQDAIRKGYDGLQRMLVNTTKYNGWAKFWGAEDQYTALADLYPELFKDGELVIDQAKRLLEVNSALDDTQKEQIRNLVDLKEKYDDAMSAIDSVISETMGNLGSDITDIIWNSVMSGADAWKEFGKVGSSVITALGKQLIQEMVISSYLDNFREDMRSAYMLGNPNDTQMRLREIVGSIFGGLQSVFEAGTAAAREWQEWATQNGFDLTEAQERTAASKAISGVSQESFNETSGRVTSIQLSAFSIDETTKAIREQQSEMVNQVAQILLVLSGIHGDTGTIREAVAGLREDMATVKSNLGTMADKGVRMLN